MAKKTKQAVPTLSTTEIVENITVARVRLLMKHPFFGNLATRLVIKDASDWCKTAATDGRCLYYNKEFFSKLTVPNLEFVIAHEVLHNAYDHFGRRGDRNKELFNYAADFCVNGTLVNDKIGEWEDKAGICLDSKYNGMCSEEIYDLLFEQFEQDESFSGKLLDEHLDWSDDGDEDGDGSGDGEGGRPRYSKEELSQMRDDMREAVMSASQAAGIGKTPLGIQRLFKDLFESKMNWRELLNQQIQSTIKNDYTWMRPNRKSWHLSAILPGSKLQEKIEICIALDMSGSISAEQCKEFLSEIKGIMEEYTDFAIKLWCFDTKVYNMVDFDAYNMDDFDNYKPMGGGGTDFNANWEFMKDNDIVPKKFIFFTDGYCENWGDPEYCDTVFIIHGNDTIIPPHGTVAYYDN